MPRFEEAFIQQVQQATDIVDLVSEYVALKKRGKEFVGLCPFHQDSHPSMNVSPAKQIFKCFACGAGGTAFNFLMMYDKLEFPDAVRRLAERANIPVPEQRRPTEQARAGLSRNDLLAASLFAARWFREQLHSDAGRHALEYARGRGLTDESIKRFGLGYAPDGWDGLLRAATAKGISDRQLVAAGLCGRKDETGRCYDRFRNRLMFPIIEPGGKPVAFGGRALGDDPAKYLNSPETQLFDKSGVLYALNWARSSIVSSKRVIVTEGYLDALMPIQAGVENVVATLGTSLTDRHVRLLARYADDVVLLFDADTAGQGATERALETFLSQRFHVRVATVPSGKDPCDMVLAEGPDALRRLADEAPDALQYAWDRTYEAWTSADDRPADRGQIVDGFLRLVASSAAYGAINEVRRGQLAQYIGHVLNVPAPELQQHMRRLARRVPRERVAAPEEAGRYTPQRLAERQVLEVLLNEPELFDIAAERVDPEDFTTPALRTVAERIWQLGASGRVNPEDVVASEALAQHGALIADLSTDGEHRGNYEATLAGALDDMVYRRRRSEIDQLSQAEPTDDALRELTRRLKEADVRRLPRIT